MRAASRLSLNLGLLAQLPVAWCAQLLHAGLPPPCRPSESLVLSGLQALRGTGPALALADFQRPAPLTQTVLTRLGKLAVAGIFLISPYIVRIKDIAIGRVETAWGLWFFTFCVISSLPIPALTSRLLKARKMD